MRRDELEKTLLGIDEEAFLLLGDKRQRPKVVLVGGAAFLLRRITPRKVTHDIDVYKADDVVCGILEKYPELNSRVAAYSDQIPYNFEDRVAKLGLPTLAIDFVTPSVEDLVVMKLYAERPNDLQDIDGAAASESIDWERLEYLVYDAGEARASSLSEKQYREMTEAFERMKARCGR